MGLAVDVAVGLAVGLAAGLTVDIAGGLAMEHAAGLAVVITVGLATGLAMDLAAGLAVNIAAAGLASGLSVGLSVGLALDLAVDITVSLAVGLAPGLGARPCHGSCRVSCRRSCCGSSHGALLWKLPRGLTWDAMTITTAISDSTIVVLPVAAPWPMVTHVPCRGMPRHATDISNNVHPCIEWTIEDILQLPESLIPKRSIRRGMPGRSAGVEVPHQQAQTGLATKAGGLMGLPSAGARRVFASIDWENGSDLTVLRNG